MLLARRYYIPALIMFILQYVGYALYVVFKGVPSPVSLALGIACGTPDPTHLFVLGLVAGSLSTGVAKTAVPFIRAEAVLLGGWLPAQAFIDSIAIANMIPAPFVIFATFVGFQGGYIHGGLGYAFAGATVITLGMFFPCFLFTIAGHHLLEKLVCNKVRIAINIVGLSKFLLSVVFGGFFRRHLWRRCRRHCGRGRTAWPRSAIPCPRPCHQCFFLILFLLMTIATDHNDGVWRLADWPSLTLSTKAREGDAQDDAHVSASQIACHHVNGRVAAYASCLEEIAGMDDSSDS